METKIINLEEMRNRGFFNATEQKRFNQLVRRSIMLRKRRKRHASAVSTAIALAITMMAIHFRWYTIITCLVTLAFSLMILEITDQHIADTSKELDEFFYEDK